MHENSLSETSIRTEHLGTPSVKNVRNWRAKHLIRVIKGLGNGRKENTGANSHF